MQAGDILTAAEASAIDDLADCLSDIVEDSEIDMPTRLYVAAIASLKRINEAWLGEGSVDD